MADSQRTIRVWGIIPAAGMSRRMGRPKQTLPYTDSTMAGTLVRTMLAAGAHGVVVVSRSELVGRLSLPADPRLHAAINDDAGSEMIDSVRIGLASLDTLDAQADDGVLVVPGDMPALRVETCTACIGAFAADPGRIVIATHAGRHGHPIIFPFGLRPTVDRLIGGLRELAERFAERVYGVETDDPGVTRDVDTPADYEQL